MKSEEAREVDEIKKLRENGELSEALIKCQETRQSPELLRLKGFIHRNLGDPRAAYDAHRAAAQHPNRKDSDLYLAAHAALHVDEYGIALAYCHDLIDTSDSKQGGSFVATAHFLAAYCHMELGQLDKALVALERAVALDSSISVPIPGVEGLPTSGDLQREIQRRKYGSIG